MSVTCGCCEGLKPLTPLETANRPGLPAVAYRAGTHATFLETMRARLSSAEYPALAGLTTRAAEDPAVALLDAWATVADVLTFYQERIANEGFLRTATERRSVVELARLVGYAPRPGVAASVYLAFTLAGGHRLEIPAGTRAQSVPGPGETLQPFETAEKLEARAEWNVLKPRMTRPQYLTDDNADRIDTLYFDGLTTNLEPNDPLLIALGENADGGEAETFLRRVRSVQTQPDENRTKVELQGVAGAAETAFVDAVRRTAEVYLDVERFRVNPDAVMAGRVVGVLEELRDAAERNEPVERLTELVRESLPRLRDEYASAVRGGYGRLEPWVGALTAELERAEGAMLSRRTVTTPLTLSALARPRTSTNGDGPPPVLKALDDLLGPLSRRPAVQPANASRLQRSVGEAFVNEADVVPRLLLTLNPALRPVLYEAWKNAVPTRPIPVRVYAFRVTASLFGHNALREPQYEPATIWDGEFRVPNPTAGNPKPQSTWPEWSLADDEANKVLWLDTVQEKILPGSYLVIQKPNSPEANIATSESVVLSSRNAYGLSSKTTKVTLSEDWWAPRDDNTSDDFGIVRGTTIYAQAEALPLAEEPITDPVCGDSIELDDLYDGLQAGRWVVVSGERSDIEDADGESVGGVNASELVMLTGVRQDVQKVSAPEEKTRVGVRDGTQDGTDTGKTQDLPGDKTHSTIALANQGLSYCYKRDTIEIRANVALATHGETRSEVLGSGDAGEPLQRFSLKQSPLTHVAAPTPTGTESTLEAYVNDVRWHEAGRLAGLGPSDRRFVTQADDAGGVTLVFGDGEHGARVPTGVENVRAVYRTGIGAAGNVAADRISLLATRPLGLEGVINPLAATGGADRETRDQARRNAPLAVMALDRLVSVRDYEDFARAFAGIGKASARRLSDGRKQLVHLTIAGADDVPIAADSELLRNLIFALRRFGDPHLPLRVETRELVTLIVSARVGVLPDHLWESVEPGVRAALLDAFGFERRELGRDALLSEAISTAQRVPGVAYVDVDVFGGIPEKVVDDETGERRLLLPGDIGGIVADLAEGQRYRPSRRVAARLAGPAGGEILPAQLAVLTPRVPDTLILTEINA